MRPTYRKSRAPLAALVTMLAALGAGGVNLIGQQPAADLNALEVIQLPTQPVAKATLPRSNVKQCEGV